MRSDLLQSPKSGSRPRLVLDLDSTLFCVSPRTQFILRQFPNSKHAETFEDDHHEVLESLKTIETNPRDWGIRSSLIRNTIKARIDFFEALRKHWVQHFFSNAMLVHDIPYDGAVEFVSELHQLGVHISYLTGRDVPRMGKGTEDQLKRYGLPLDSPEDLQMKPRAGLEDADYKVNHLKSLGGDLTQTWFVDNEPMILHAVENRVPEINLIYTDTVHSGIEQPSPSWPSIGMSWK